MAHRELYLTDKGAGFYRTRMLSAGDPITLSGPEARLQTILGHVVAQKPRRARQAPTAPAPEPVTPPAPKPRRTRRKKTAE